MNNDRIVTAVKTMFLRFPKHGIKDLKPVAAQLVVDLTRSLKSNYVIEDIEKGLTKACYQQEIDWPPTIGKIAKCMKLERGDRLLREKGRSSTSYDTTAGTAQP